MNMIQAVKSCFSNYAGFGGRSRRSEYWYFALFSTIVQIVLSVITADATGTSPVQGLWSLATLLPNIAVAVRRLHDVGRSGWWLLIAFTGIGAFVLLYWNVQKSDPMPNQFGPSPIPGG